ncbi:MAG: aldehyde dehydrogenase family protein [Methyloligellaceae bacterium]
MLHEINKLEPTFEPLDKAIAELKANKDKWAATGIEERIALLNEMRDALLEVSEAWAQTAARKKQIAPGSPLAGEEWFAGPAAVLSGINGFITTLSQMKDKAYLKKLPVRELPNGQISVTSFPGTLWDKLLLTGIKADVWMQQGITKDNLKANTASTYDIPAEQRKGKVSLVLGAGNISAIAPLDCFHKLFIEHQVVILKMNPVNDYIADFLQVALKPLVELGALRIVMGDSEIGEFLCNHPDIEEIHITGSEAVHDIIVWGAGEEGRANKQARTPRNTRRITSELGAVCPTIVVPGPWSDKDLQFQAEHIASQKLHNSGFNCVACQVLVMPEKWDSSNALLERIEEVISGAPSRLPYYPGARKRMDDFESHGDNVLKFERPGVDDFLLAKEGDSWFSNNEVFGPAMSTHTIDETGAEEYLRSAIRYANEELHGTLGANIVIHPKTLKKIGKKKFEAIISDLHYGCIAINSWTGVGFQILQTPWGAFPGHTLDDVQSGIGFVHNTYMFDRPERTIVWAPFRASPRPAWFITNKMQHKIGERIVKFLHKPGWLRFLGILKFGIKG